MIGWVLIAGGAAIVLMKRSRAGAGKSPGERQQAAAEASARDNAGTVDSPAIAAAAKTDANEPGTAAQGGGDVAAARKPLKSVANRDISDVELNRRLDAAARNGQVVIR